MTPEPRFHMGKCHCGHGWKQTWHRDRGWECRTCYERRPVIAPWDTDLILRADVVERIKQSAKVE